MMATTINLNERYGLLKEKYLKSNPYCARTLWI